MKVYFHKEKVEEHVGHRAAGVCDFLRLPFFSVPAGWADAQRQGWLQWPGPACEAAGATLRAHAWHCAALESVLGCLGPWQAQQTIQLARLQIREVNKGGTKSFIGAASWRGLKVVGHGIGLVR